MPFALPAAVVCHQSGKSRPFFTFPQTPSCGPLFTTIRFSPRCEKEEDLAMIAAQQYFIEFGTDMSADRLMNLLPNYIPDYCLTGDKPVEHWHALIMQAFKKSYYVKERVPDLKAKEDVVSYAKYKWPLLFSRFYEAFRYSGDHTMINLVPEIFLAVR